MTLPREVRAVVFDMDGLLVDSETLCRDAMMHQAGVMGLDLPMPVFLSMVGSNHARSERILMDHFGAGVSVAEFHAGWTARYYAEAEAGVALKAGVVELLDLLDIVGLPRAVCTSSTHKGVDRNIGTLGLKPRFNAIVASGDYTNGKPHPDPFLRAAEVLAVDPTHCLALEDSHNGVRAAHAAGMMTVMVPDLLEPTEEIRTLCVRIAETLHDVREMILAQSRPGEQA